MLDKRWRQGKKKRLHQNLRNTIELSSHLVREISTTTTTTSLHQLNNEPIIEPYSSSYIIQLLNKQQKEKQRTKDDHHLYDKKKKEDDEEEEEEVIAASASDCINLLLVETIETTTIITAILRYTRILKKEVHNMVNQQRHYGKLMTIIKPESAKSTYSKVKYLLRIVVVVPYYIPPPPHAINTPTSIKCKLLYYYYFPASSSSSSSLLKPTSSQHIIAINDANHHEHFHKLYCRHYHENSLEKCIYNQQEHLYSSKHQAKEANEVSRWCCCCCCCVNLKFKRGSCLSNNSQRVLCPFILLLLVVVLLIFEILLLLLLFLSNCHSKSNQISTGLPLFDYDVNDGDQQSHIHYKSASASSSSSSSWFYGSHQRLTSKTRTTTITTAPTIENVKNFLPESTVLGQQLHTQPLDPNHQIIVTYLSMFNNNNNINLLEATTCCSMITLQQVTGAAAVLPIVACCLITALNDGKRRWSILHFSLDHYKLTSSRKRHTIRVATNITTLNSMVVVVVVVTNKSSFKKSDHFIITHKIQSYLSTSSYLARFYFLEQSSSNNAGLLVFFNTPTTIKKQFDWHHHRHHQHQQRHQRHQKKKQQRIIRQHTNEVHLLKSSLDLSTFPEQPVAIQAELTEQGDAKPINTIHANRTERSRRNIDRPKQRLFLRKRAKITTTGQTNGCWPKSLMVNIVTLWLILNIFDYMCLYNNNTARLVNLCSCSPAMRQNRSSYSLYTTLRNIKSQLDPNTRHRRMDIMIQKDSLPYTEYLVTDMCQWKNNLFVPTSNDVYFSSYERNPARRIILYKQLLESADQFYQDRFNSNMMHGKIFSPPTTSPSIVLKIPTMMYKAFNGYEPACSINLIAPTGLRILARIYGRQAEFNRDEEDKEQAMFNVSYLERSSPETGRHIVAESQGNIMSFRFLLDKDNYLRDPKMRFYVVATAFTTTADEDIARQIMGDLVFRCDQQRLIDRSLVCDNYTNCEDGTDEDKSNCYYATLDPTQLKVTELYPGQKMTNENDQIFKNLGTGQAPKSDQTPASSSSWIFGYWIMWLILLMLFVSLMTLLCLAMIFRRHNRNANSRRRGLDDNDGLSSSLGSGVNSILKKRSNRNRYRDNSLKGSLATTGTLNSKSSSLTKHQDPTTISITPGGASSTTSMLPSGSSATITARPSAGGTLSSASSTLTRPVPAKRVTKSPNRAPSELSDQQQQPQQPSRLTVQQQGYFSMEPAAGTRSRNMEAPPTTSSNYSYYHQTTMSRSYATPSPGGSILVPSGTLRTVHMQTDRTPSYQSSPPSSLI